MKYPKSEKLIYELLKKEIAEHGIEVDIIPTTKNKSALDIIKRHVSVYLETAKNIILDAKAELDFNDYCIAYYDYLDKRLKVIIDSVKEASRNTEEYLWLLLKTIYHEYKHAIVQNSQTKGITNLNDFYLTIEHLFENPYSANLQQYYKYHHDDFYEEILANQYGIEKAAQYLEPKIKKTARLKKVAPWIKIEKIKNKIQYQNYDIQPFLVEVDDVVKMLEEKSYILEETKQNILLPIIYNEDGTYKKLTELQQDDNWNLLPTEVKYQIISTKSYLAEQNYKELDKDTIEFILNSINYVRNLTTIKQEKNKNSRQELDTVSKTLKSDDSISLNLYVNTLLELNEKEDINKDKLKYLNEEKTKLLSLYKQDAKTLKKKIYFIDAD